jgi:quercetin dioxygenase-like cupin family protein
MKHVKWQDIPYEKLNDQFLRKIAYDGKIMIGLTEVEKGYVVVAHSPENEQMTIVFSGKWRFTIDGVVTDVGPNETIFIPANAVHSAEALETLVAYDVFTPVRQDWLSGSDAYLRDTAE